MKLRRYRCLVVVIAVALGLASGCTNLRNSPTGTVERKYSATGPWAVTTKLAGACCDSSGNTFDLFFPTNLGANGFKHPLLTWGNGTFAKPSNYAYFLDHMASWGFVVIATEDPTTGSGQTILDAAKFLITANQDPNSPFFSKLDVSRVGAFGHSQGAHGAINALLKSGGSVQTVLPIELPAQIWCAANCFDTRDLTVGSVFFVDGTADPISPPTQPPWVTGEQSIDAYYSAVPNSVPKLKGTLIGPGHTDVQGQPDCSTVPIGCIIGVYGYLGYPTAWFMDQLQGDAFAHAAFVTGTGEMFSQITNWDHVDSNIH